MFALAPWKVKPIEGETLMVPPVPQESPNGPAACGEMECAALVFEVTPAELTAASSEEKSRSRLSEPSGMAWASVAGTAVIVLTEPDVDAVSTFTKYPSGRSVVGPDARISPGANVRVEPAIMSFWVPLLAPVIELVSRAGIVNVVLGTKK